MRWAGRRASTDRRRASISPTSRRSPSSGPIPAAFRRYVLAREALVLGGFAPIVLNAANEVAVAAFLARRIGFLDIARIVEDVMVGERRTGGSGRVRCSRSRRPIWKPGGGPKRLSEPRAKQLK